MSVAIADDIVLVKVSLFEIKFFELRIYLFFKGQEKRYPRKGEGKRQSEGEREGKGERERERKGKGS